MSDTDSVKSYETNPSSTASSTLPPLQHNQTSENVGRMSPLLEDDPKSFDLVAAPSSHSKSAYSLEAQSDLLFSKAHLQAIFDDPTSLHRFTAFLTAARPKSVPVLIYYLDALKAIRAINYANAIAEALDPIDGLEFTNTPARPTVNAVLEDKARRAFDVLVRDDLPAYITHVFIQVVSVSVQKRVTGNLPIMLREASEGLAEVFCLSDPSRSDNPIIFASEEFHRTTQYGVNYAIGRNCRFLQGPKTNRNSIARLAQAVRENKETNEVFLNYRRDGSPFMNLLMFAPLIDSRGNTRYHIGAQIDVSGLVKDSTDLDALQQLITLRKAYTTAQQQQQQGRRRNISDLRIAPPKDEFHDLSEMFNLVELETVRRFGGSMHQQRYEEREGKKAAAGGKDGVGVGGAVGGANPRADGKLSGVYKHYLILRPHPSLRILFVSPSLRVPGILQSRFLDRIGGSHRVRDSLSEALADGSRGVTAKVRWLTSAAAKLDVERPDEGRPRWIHCTPLLGASGAVGVWMVVLVDDDKGNVAPTRRFRPAPPVPSTIGREKHVDREKDRDKRNAWSPTPTPTPAPRERRMSNVDFETYAQQQQQQQQQRAQSRNGYRRTSHQSSVDRTAGAGGSRNASQVRRVDMTGLRDDVLMHRSYSPVLVKGRSGSAEPSINSFAL
ncbi:hypothetical protein DM02DRAFT_520981 [Periconia macrospinosa]|uniref:PAC domain-containing protein n=1 Tax=Periconia macrospinosa TaxID=97972 RepID=A0A2V1DYA3_9PLEO|nr:hypothetical protein DM02DRAFT_520981 [Periconia macrospinosa]